MESLKELVERLNLSDECSDLEAKKASEIGKSLLETVCTSSDLLKSFIDNEEDNLSAPPIHLSAPPATLSALPRIAENIPENIIKQIDSLGKRTNDKDKISSIILQLCAHKAMKSKAIASVLGKSEKYILREFLKPLLDEKRISYTIPEMINHPDQAYISVEKPVEER